MSFPANNFSFLSTKRSLYVLIAAGSEAALKIYAVNDNHEDVR